MLTADGLSEEQVLALMREAVRLQEDCRIVLLPRSKPVSADRVDSYQECIGAALAAYNAGTQCLNDGKVVGKASKSKARKPRTRV